MNINKNLRYNISIYYRLIMTFIILLNSMPLKSENINNDINYTNSLECHPVDLNLSKMIISCKSGDFIKLQFIKKNCSFEGVCSNATKANIARISDSVGTVFSGQGSSARQGIFGVLNPKPLNCATSRKDGLMAIGRCAIERRDKIIVDSGEDVGCILVRYGLAKFRKNAPIHYKKMCSAI